MGEFTRDDLVRVKNRVTNLIQVDWIPINTDRDSFMVTNELKVTLDYGSIVVCVKLPAGTFLKYPVKTWMKNKWSQYNQSGYTYFLAGFSKSAELMEAVKIIQRLWWLNKLAKREFQLAKGQPALAAAVGPA